MAQPKVLPIRIDPVTVVASGASSALIFSLAKLWAYRYHEHPIAQAILLVL